MSFLRRLWVNWRRFGLWLGDQVARLWLMFFYFTVALPFGLGLRWFADPLGLKTLPSWEPKQAGDANLDSARKLY